MDRKQIALQAFSDGYNCAQSVLVSYCGELGLDEKTAKMIATGFGGGMRQGEVCGAISGAVMALGIKYGQSEASDTAAKKRVSDLTRQLQSKFREKRGSLLCKDLLNCNVSKEEGNAYAQANNLFNTVCPQLIGEAVDILDEIFAENSDCSDGGM